MAGLKEAAAHETATKYEIIINWSEPDQAFIAEIPELPGCIADGATAAEALHNVERVAKEWIDTAQELGRAIPEPKGRLTPNTETLEALNEVDAMITSGAGDHFSGSTADFFKLLAGD